MRRLRNSRSPDPDELAAEGFDRSDLEGDAIGTVADEIPWLRPFGADIPGPALAEPGSAPEPEGVRILRQARDLAGLGRRLDAVLLLRRWLEDSPGDPAARSHLAELLEQGGELEAALVELNRALEVWESSVPLLVRRGGMLARMGQSAEAERDLREAIRLGPTDPAGHFQLGLALLRRGRAAAAADAFREALRLSPDHPDALYYLGEALEAQGDLPAALRTLERTATLFPEDPRTYKLMGRLLDRMGRSEEAMAMHRKAREASIR